MSREILDEVREFAEACGWSYEPSEWDGFQYTQSAWVSPHKLWSTDLPDFLHDLAACFEGIRRFTTDWDLSCRNEQAFECTVYFPSEEYSAVELTPQAAIIRAVNAAARARRKV